MPPITRGSRNSISDFGPQPGETEIRDVALALCRMTRWGLSEVLELRYEEALWWLDGANELEKKIQDR